MGPKTAGIPAAYVCPLSVAGKILTFSLSHPPLINSLLTDEIYFLWKEKKLMGYFQTATSGARQPGSGMAGGQVMTSGGGGDRQQRRIHFIMPGDIMAYAMVLMRPSEGDNNKHNKYSTARQFTLVYY